MFGSSWMNWLRGRIHSNASTAQSRQLYYVKDASGVPVSSQGGTSYAPTASSTRQRRASSSGLDSTISSSFERQGSALGGMGWLKFWRRRGDAIGVAPRSTATTPDSAAPPRVESNSAVLALQAMATPSDTNQIYYLTHGAGALGKAQDNSGVMQLTIIGQALRACSIAGRLIRHEAPIEVEAQSPDQQGETPDQLKSESSRQVPNGEEKKSPVSVCFLEANAGSAGEKSILRGLAHAQQLKVEGRLQENVVIVLFSSSITQQYEYTSDSETHRSVFEGQFGNRLTPEETKALAEIFKDSKVRIVTCPKKDLATIVKAAWAPSDPKDSSPSPPPLTQAWP